MFHLPGVQGTVTTSVRTFSGCCRSPCYGLRCAQRPSRRVSEGGGGGDVLRFTISGQRTRVRTGTFLVCMGSGINGVVVFSFCVLCLVLLVLCLLDVTDG